MNDQATLAPGPNERSVSGTADPLLLQRAREFDADRRAHEAGNQDKIVINGQPLVDGQPPAEPAPAAPAPAKPSPAPAETVKPLEMPVSGRPWLTAEQVMEQWKKDGVGNVVLQHWNRDGSNVEADLPFGIAVQAGILDHLDDDDLAAFKGILDELGVGFQGRLLKAAAKFGRPIAATPGDASTIRRTTTTTKGQQMAEFEFSGSPAQLQAEYRKLTTEIHNKMAMGQTWEAAELDKRRSALGRILTPGMNAPEGVF